MNTSPDKRVIYDADEARRKYKEARNKDIKPILSAIICIVVAGLLILLSLGGFIAILFGAHSSFGGTVNGIYKNSIDNPGYVLSRSELSLDKKWSKVEDDITAKISKLYKSYCKGKAEYTEITNVLNAYAQIPSAAELTEEYKTSVESIEQGRVAFAKAKDLRIAGDMAGALSAYLCVDENDTLNYKTAIKKAKEVETEGQDAISYKINTYLCKFDIEGAKSFANSIAEKLGESEFISSELDRIDAYYTEQTDLVPYTDHVEHLFTHCLIAYPELCYSSPSMTASLDEDCITPSEFIKILNALYEKNYILIDINMLINETEDGVEIADIMVPRGKTPFIFSVDDVTYDSRKMHTGMVDKLIVGEDGRVCTYTLHDDGTEVISYENECFPILDEFVRQHPDFTFQGARGTLCNTGFDGVFGYRTQNDPKEDVDPEYEKQQALLVAQALKDEGWTFASHSYGHAQMGDCTVDFVKEDTDKWIAEVTAIIGETKIMVWPYGNSIRSGEAHKYLYDSGFRLFCGVGVKPFMTKEPDGLGIFMDRKALDGYSLRNRRDKYMYLFDTEEVWDPLRPKEVTW
ncbi:MAG: hypothetical protein IKT46_05340 [Clostridia bacterium]|nr:hypothetical protein [Clostridia bacterium]